MKFPLIIAKRFMLGGRGSGPSRLTGWISIIGMMVGTFAMIISLFLVKGTIIGLVGSIFGLTLALFFGWLQMKYHILSIAEDIYFMDHIPVSFDFSQILIIIIFGITCSLLASLWPTNIASRVKPAEALQYE